MLDSGGFTPMKTSSTLLLYELSEAKEEQSHRAPRRPRYGRTACALWDERQLAEPVFPTNQRSHYLASYKAGTLKGYYSGERASTVEPHGAIIAAKIYGEPCTEGSGGQILSEKRAQIAADRQADWEVRGAPMTLYNSVSRTRIGRQALIGLGWSVRLRGMG